MIKNLFLLFLVIVFVSFGLASDSKFNRERTFDALHYTMRIKVDRDKRMVFGDSSIKLKPLRDNFRELRLDTKDTKFSSVKLEGTDTKLDFNVYKDRIVISLDRPYSMNEEINVRLEYTSKPSKGVYFVDEVKKGGKILLHSQVWTQGEAEEAHHWLPSFDFPDDKATTEQFITANKGETVIGNGNLLETVENPDGTQTFHYKMPVPHSVYLISFVIGKYAKITENYGNIPLSYYVYPGQEAIVPQAFGRTKNMMKLFEDRTKVKFPYNKYDQTIVANFQFGGMENITATTLADNEILSARAMPTTDLVDDLVSHELAHSWFGDLVTCRNWAELWLNEGFASYFEAVYRESTLGRIGYVRKIQEDTNIYFSYDSGLKSGRHALYNEIADPNSEDLFDPITYQKGSAVIHMLREEVGTPVFWKAINSYLQKFAFKNVETKDLQAEFEEASGRDLDWFFNQWVYDQGYPQFEISPKYSPKTKTLTVKFVQKQNRDNDVPEFFQIPLEMRFRVGNKIESKSFVINSRSFTQTIPVDGKPAKIEYDPNYKIALMTISEKPLSITTK